MLKGVPIAVSLLILLLPMAQTVLGQDSLDPEEGDAPFPYYEGINNSTAVNYEDSFSLFFNNHTPRFDLLGRSKPRGFSFEMIELTHRNSRGIDIINITRERWNLLVDPLDHTFSYRTKAIWHNTGISGMNETDILLRFQPIWEGDTRRLEYNINLANNLTQGELTLSWMFRINRLMKPPHERDLERTWEPRFWNNNLTLNDSRGERLARVVWEKRAELLFENGSSYIDVEPQEQVGEEVILVDQKIDVTQEVKGVQSSGVIEIFEGLLNSFIEAGEEAVDYAMDHIYSLMMGTSIGLILIMIAFITIVRTMSDKDPEYELDYRKSRYYNR